MSRFTVSERNDSVNVLWPVASPYPTFERAGPTAIIDHESQESDPLMSLSNPRTRLLGCLFAIASLMTTACVTPTRPATGPSPAAGARPGGGGPGARGESDDGPKPYAEVVTEEAVTDSGMVHIHKVDDQYLFEIPEEILDREILLVSRTARVPQGMGYGGLKLNTQTFRWERGGDDNLYMRIVSHTNVADDSFPIFEAVRNANFGPILHAFDIEAYNEDSTAVVIDATPLFATDVPMLGLRQSFRDQYRVRQLDQNRSRIESAKSFPRNVNVRHTLTYSAQTPPSNATVAALTIEMNQSMILLPDDPMRPRIWDQRVGFFRVNQVDYGRSDHTVETRSYITRWRLEPSDPAAFRRGELVEPVKPIVYYVDPATPEKWRPYLIAGINDWNEAFEAAGFRNAIEGRLPPSFEEDPDFNPDDIRYSVIRWFPSTVQNAFGPHVHDPRTGEILESDIGWYHNVARTLRNWYLIQTAAANPMARSAYLDDEVMGNLIRFVSAHEVGHTLGLPHNMKSSAAFPVDSLRAPGLVCREGVAPSIMDYARFNYVAQPEDEGACFDPRIGRYDEYSISWGYRPILDADSSDDEKDTLDSWILERADDPVYWFGDPSGVDPTSLTEAIGSDAMEASALGIENLKRILPNIYEWTHRDGDDFAELQDLYNNVIGQWNRYMGHVLANIGGVTRTRKAYGQPGPVYEVVSRDDQARAVEFLAEQAFTAPTWMIDEQILGMLDNPRMVDRIRGLQVSVLNRTLDPSRMQRLIESEAQASDEAYQLVDLLDDVRAAVWGELDSGAAIDVYRRNLQRAYVERMEYLMTQELNIPAAFFGFGGFTAVDVSQSDIRAFVRGDLVTLRAAAQRAASRASDRTTRLHLEDVVIRIDRVLDPNG